MTPSKCNGFSLIEMAILISIYGGIAAMAATLGNGWAAKERITATRNNLQTIEMALKRYAVLHGRLPCPGQLSHTPSDDGYGYEAFEEATETLDSNVCLDSTGDIIAADATNNVVFGSVPAHTLGVEESMMRDQFGGLIVYYVIERAAEDGSFWEHPKDSNYLEIGDSDANGIVIRDKNGTNLPSEAMFTLLSHGENRHGAYLETGNRRSESTASTQELENCDCSSSAAATTLDNILISGFIDDNFDDLLLYKSRSQFSPESH